MEVVLPDSETFRITTEVLSVDALTDTITRLRLHRPQDYDYHAGQYINLYNPQGVGRNYSLASMPILDPFLELHVKLIPHGLISTWVHKDIKVGQEVTIGPAIGTNFYVGDKKDQPIILIGTSTGLAPLYGIVRDALHHGHSGEIKLYHGSGTNAGIYLMQELQQLDENHSNFEYYPCVSKESPRSGAQAGRALDLALQHNKTLSGWRAFICGDPDVVKATSKALFLAGISLQEIYLDPFLPSKPV